MRPPLTPALVLLMLSLGGCVSTPTPQAKPSAPPAAIAPDPKPANDAQSSVNAAAQERLSKLRANVDAIVSAPNIEASPVAQNEGIVAQGRLSDVKPDPVEVADRGGQADRRADRLSAGLEPLRWGQVLGVIEGHGRDHRQQFRATAYSFRPAGGDHSRLQR